METVNMAAAQQSSLRSGFDQGTSEVVTINTSLGWRPGMAWYESLRSREMLPSVRGV